MRANLGDAGLGTGRSSPQGPEPSAAAAHIRGGTRPGNPSSVAKGRPGSDALLTAHPQPQALEAVEAGPGGGAGPRASSRRPSAARGQGNGLRPGLRPLHSRPAPPRPADRTRTRSDLLRRSGSGFPRAAASACKPAKHPVSPLRAAPSQGLSELPSQQSYPHPPPPPQDLSRASATPCRTTSARGGRALVASRPGLRNLP